MIQGQLLRITPHHEAAIYLRDGSLWVADFVDGHGKLVDAAVWFRFNCPALSAPHATRRMVQESAIPLDANLVRRIEELHASAVGMDGGAPDVARTDPSHNATTDRGGMARSRYAGAVNRRPDRYTSHSAIVKASLIGLAVSLLMVAVVWFQISGHVAR